MIFRNSIKSILRTPVKTVLFTLLIAAVTAFLYLGVNTWAASDAMLRDCDDNCTTIVTMEYLDEFGSGTGSKSEAMLSDIDGIDFDAIAENENVLLWQPSNIGMGIADGFTAKDGGDYSRYCVLIVSGLSQYSEGSPYTGKLVESLYSYRPYEIGRTVFIYSDQLDIDFTPDPDATYVIHAENDSVSSSGLSVSLLPFYSFSAQQAGVGVVDPYLEIESAEDLHADADNVYNAIARYYDVMNNTLTVVGARELADIEEFNQNYLRIVSGRLFSRQEADAGAKVCVISETLANDRELKVGDTLTVHLPDDEASTAYAWGDKMSREENFTIVGIVNYHEDYHLNVYVPSAPALAQPVRYLYDLGQATIKNGTADAFLAGIEPLIPGERIFINVYDQGYQATADALNVIKKAAIALSVIAFAVTLAVLAVFAYLFEDKQRGPVEIMRCFGTSKAETRLYLMFGVSLISLVAIAAGILAGTAYAQKLVETAYAFVSELQSVDLRYSDGYLGLTKEFTPVATLSLPLAFASGAVVLFISLFLCLYFAERTVSGRLITARARVRVRRSPKKSSVALSGALRHAILSIRRGGARSFLVPVLCAAALLFVASLQSTLASYDAAREALYENTALRGYCATMRGKFSDSLYIPNQYAKKLVDSGYMDNVSYTYKINYVYLGIPERADGSVGHADPVPQPLDPYELEYLYETLFSQPNIVFTDAVEGAPEFYFEAFHGDFMPGWDEARFASRDWEKLPCIVSSQFMNEHDISLGDTIRVYVNNYLYFGPTFTGIDMQVVGSFARVANQNNIYCPLPLGALAPERSTLNKPDSDVPLKTGEYLWYVGLGDFMMRGGDIDSFLLTQQQTIDIMLDNNHVSSLTFTPHDIRNLGEFKDFLEEAGFSGPKMGRLIRICVLVEDAQFNEALGSITQRSKYLEILYPVLLALVCMLGVITGFLVVNNRREDIALMRGMGTQKRRIFATVFGEQLMLLLFGALPALAAWFMREGAAQLITLGVYAFPVCYALSAAFSVAQQNFKSALSILSEKE